MNVPFYKPHLPDYSLVERDFREVYESGMLAPGQFTERMKNAFAEYFDVRYVVPFSNCSDGMICAVGYLARNHTSGSVIVPNFTFASTLQAITWNGLTPILVDVELSTGLLSPDQVERILKKDGSVVAIMAVHMFGQPAYVEELEDLSVKYGVPVIYDSAHGVGSLYKNKPLGNWGKAEVFSIGTTKPLSAGEGGLLTTNDKVFAEAMTRAAMHGHKTGELDMEVPSLNGRIQEINSIMAYHALQTIDEQIDKRNERAQEYIKLLEDSKFRVLEAREEVRSTWKDFTVVVDGDVGSLRDKLLEHGIATKRYYYPSLQSLAMVESGEVVVNKTWLLETMNHADYLASHCLSLPFYTDMTTEEVEYVAKVLKEV